MTQELGHDQGLAQTSPRDCRVSDQLATPSVDGLPDGVCKGSSAEDSVFQADPPGALGAGRTAATADGQSLPRDAATSSTASTWKDAASMSSDEPVVQQLLRKISHVGNGQGDDGPKTAANYTNFPAGFQQRNYYAHSKKLTDLVDVTYNPRTRQFIFLDTRGITTWNKDGIEHTVSRSLSYPKYVNKLLRNIIYARKYNVYFCLAKDFSLKVLNKDFDETCNVASDLSSVMFLLFNPVRDELITGGVKGTKVWEFKQVTDQVWTEIKPMANYGLFLKRELSGIKGGWIRKVELEQQLQHLYCCSDTDVLCYNMDGKPLFKLIAAHKSQINGCKYSPQARMLITCSNDSDVKVWSMTGGHVHTFRGHSRAVTGVVLHPETSTLVLTSSTDGTVRMWSLDIMEAMYTIVISTDGIEWMGLTGERFLWTATHRDLAVWHLNHVVQFYALARCRVTALHVAACQGKTSRLVALGEDSSVRLISMRDQKSLSTVLPPPSVSPLQQVLGVTYNRECSMVYLLINPQEIWVYTMRTDPACRTAIWDTKHLQNQSSRAQSAVSRAGSAAATSPRHRPVTRGSSSVQIGHPLPGQRATLQGRGAHQLAAPCTSITTLTSPLMYWTEEGFVCPLNHNFLVLGLKDGRILFMDLMEYGVRYCELQASKDAIFDMTFDSSHSALIAKSHLRDEDVFQFWSLPSLELQHLVIVPRDVTSYTRLGSVFLTGHSDGSLMLHHLSADINTAGHSINEEGDEAMIRQRRRDHLAPIVAVDSCSSLEIFVSCSSDGAVKVWDADKMLLTELALEEPISTALFVNATGDLMLGYMNHLFAIDHSKILPSSSKSQVPDENLETESEIYEDPAVRYEGAAANPDPLDMESYLVPYNLDYNQRFRGGRSSPTSSHASSIKSGEDDSGSEFSMAPTEMYTSPSITPRQLSVIDLLTSGRDASKEEISRKVRALSLSRKRRSKSSKLNLTGTDAVPQDFDMPQFGTSPGPSPTPSPPSSCSEFDVSEDESEPEEDGEEDDDEDLKGDEAEVDERSKLILQLAAPDLKVARKESRELGAGDIRLSDLKQPPEEVSKYSLSKMKIDTKSLLKPRKPVAIPKPLKLDTTSQPMIVAEEDVKTTQEKAKKPAGPSRMKTPIKKKAKKGERVRVGDRAAAAAPSQARLITPETPPDDIPTPLLGGRTESKTTTTVTKLTMSLEDGAVEKHGSQSSVSSSSPVLISPQRSDPSAKPRAKVSVPGLPKVPRDTKTEDKKAPKARDKAVKQKPEKAGQRSILEDWKKPKTPKPAVTELAAVISGSDDETQRATSAGTSGSGGLPAGSIHGDEVATDLGEGTTAMYKAASRMAIANKYNPLRSKSPVASPITLPDAQDDELAGLPDAEADWQWADPPPSPRPSSRSGGVTTPAGTTAPPTPETGPGTPALTSGRSSRAQGPFDDSDQEIDSGPALHWATSDQPTVVATSPKVLSSSPVMRPTRSPVAMPLRPTTRPRERDRSRLEETPVPSAPAKEPIRVRGELEGRLARPNTAEGRLSGMSQRPHTASTNLRAEEEELLDGHDTPIARYLSCPGSPVDLKHIYRNDGLHFEDNWQEKMIVRHQILKQQKEQRAQSAADRRRLLELRKRQRRKALLGHHYCTADGNGEASPHDVYVTRSDTSLHEMKRCKSAPIGRMVPSSPPVEPRHAFGQSKEQDLSTERPYRFRISRAPPLAEKPRVAMEDVFEEADPDRPHPGSLLVKRPHSTKSIPSKTRRYVLVTKVHDDPDVLVPTTLERHLLAERFPQTKHRLRNLPEPRRRGSIHNMELINFSSVGDAPFS